MNKHLYTACTVCSIFWTQMSPTEHYNCWNCCYHMIISDKSENSGEPHWQTMESETCWAKNDRVLYTSNADYTGGWLSLKKEQGIHLSSTKSYHHCYHTDFHSTPWAALCCWLLQCHVPSRLKGGSAHITACWDAGSSTTSAVALRINSKDWGEGSPHVIPAVHARTDASQRE